MILLDGLFIFQICSPFWGTNLWRWSRFKIYLIVSFYYYAKIEFIGKLKVFLSNFFKQIGKIKLFFSNSEFLFAIVTPLLQSGRHWSLLFHHSHTINTNYPLINYRSLLLKFSRFKQSSPVSNSSANSTPTEET